MSKFILIGILGFASAAWSDTGQLVCASSDMNGGIPSAQAKLNAKLNSVIVKSMSAPVIVSDTYFTTICVSITK